MQLVYNVEVDDLVALTDHHVRHSPAVQRQVQILRFACAGLSLLACGGAGYLVGERGWIWLLGGVVGAVIGILFFPRWFYRANQRNSRKLYEEGRNAAILGQHTLTLDDEGLRDVDPSGESRTAWSAVERIDTTADYVFLYVGAVAAYAIARRRVVDGDLDAFVAAVRERIEAAPGSGAAASTSG